MPRLFVDMPLSLETDITLPEDTHHYVRNVLRLRPGAPVCLFNGLGGEYTGQLIESDKKNSKICLSAFVATRHESALSLTLVQAISKPEHMDYTIQKAVELGVSCIVPVLTERSPPLDVHRMAKRYGHWQKIITSACEQCGRNQLPQLVAIAPLTEYLNHHVPDQLALLLAPDADNTLSEVATAPVTSVSLLIGAEGGLTAEEIVQATQVGYQGIHLGPRTLRTETAAITILAISQFLWGDLNARADIV